MIKVFLVEDEVIVREGIKNNIDWEKCGYKFSVFVNVFSQSIEPFSALFVSGDCGGYRKTVWLCNLICI